MNTSPSDAPLGAALRRGAGLLGILAVAALALRPAARAQSASEPAPGDVTDPAVLAAERVAAERAHLRRVGAWGLANAAGGVALWASSDSETARAFGQQSAAWGAINTAIAAVGLARSGGEPPDDMRGALDAEKRLSDVLLVNLGLNVGYAAVGATMIGAAGQGVRNPEAWRGHGAALVVQGAGLPALDAVVYAGSRGRYRRLAQAGIAVAPVPGGASVTVRL